mmetsp:Transcript_51765/g.108162  ORF Transcript_51765/g.108162 Transcript_51765/m.108162 type:complete len:201 (+) Transcript_51765:826-1428(+)
MPVLALAQAEEQLLSLRFDVHALMSPKESSDLKARQKNMAAGVGDKRERSHPDAASNSDEGDLQALAQYPWNQRWKNRPSLSFVHARASVADRAHFLQRALLRTGHHFGPSWTQEGPRRYLLRVQRGGSRRRQRGRGGAVHHPARYELRFQQGQGCPAGRGAAGAGVPVVLSISLCSNGTKGAGGHDRSVPRRGGKAHHH